ncbi:hypothetical protein [Clostridium tyrobutyricum]|uniref:hypothetical protein n=1 Tax=Clostridium tyrobutyricum TaxID=1519 RepID=UPI0011CB8DF4|nr:hypothetical protein [Clostridium tyrobutyricum]
MNKKYRPILNTFIFLFLFLSVYFNFSSNITKAAPIYNTTIASAVSTTNKGNVSFDLNKTDTTKAQKTVTYYIYMFGGSLVAFATGLTAIRMILSRNSETKREEVMSAFGKIILGTSIIGSCILLSGFLIGIANHMGSVLTGNTINISNIGANTIDDDNGNFIVRAFANIFLAVEKAFFGLAEKFLGFLPLDKLIFNSKVNSFGSTGNISVPPFTDAEWGNLNYIYIVVSSLCAPFVLIMVAKTGISLIMSANQPAKRSELQENISRWLFSLALIAIGPLLLKGLFLFTSYMTDAVVSLFHASLGGNNYVTNTSMIDSIKTGSVLTSAIVKCVFAWKFFQINMLFMVRKIVLFSMYAFTPLAALFWGIDNKTQALQVWFGEIITNATMQFFYAFTFSIMIIGLSGSSWQNWFYALVWMFTLVKIAEVFRNSLQGLFTKLAGVDENAIAGKAFGPVSAAAAGAIGAFKRTFTGSGASKLANGLSGGFKDSVLGGAILSGMGRNNKNSNSNNDANFAKDVASMTSAGQGPDLYGNQTKKTSNPDDFTNSDIKDNSDLTNDPNIYDATKASGETSNESTKQNNIKDSNEVPGSNFNGNPEAANDFKNSYDSNNPDTNFENTNSDGIPNSNFGYEPANFDGIPNSDSGYEPISSNNIGTSDEAPYSDTEIPNGTSNASGESDTVDVNSFNGLPPIGDITDSNGNVNMNNLSAASSRHAMYSSMLSDNIKKYSNNRPVSSKIFGGISRAANFRNEGMSNRIIAGKAINDTVKQMQSLAGGENKLSKKEALSQLFGSPTKNLNKNIGGHTVNLNYNKNAEKFKSAIAKADMGRASQILADANPVNKLSLKQQSAVIAKTKPYTKIDGFRW